MIHESEHHRPDNAAAGFGPKSQHCLPHIVQSVEPTTLRGGNPFLLGKGCAANWRIAKNFFQLSIFAQSSFDLAMRSFQIKFARKSVRAATFQRTIIAIPFYRYFGQKNFDYETELQQVGKL